MASAEATSAARQPSTKEDQWANEFRQRRAATFAQDARGDSPAGGSRGPPPLGRRTSSFVTNSSLDSARISVADSTTDLLSPRATGNQDEFFQEPSLLHSLPLLFAILPAIGGVAFKKGSVFMTDLALLVLAAIYLNWCLRTPWVWYHSAQSTKLAEFPVPESPFEDSREDLSVVDEPESNTSRTNGEGGGDQAKDKEGSRKGSKSASDELQMHELAALTLCFIGPVLGSYILHLVRTQLSEIGDQLVSNMHLTLFVLGAELRPLRHLMKMIQARTLHLQRVVREDPHAQTGNSSVVGLSDLQTRLSELETNFSTIQSSPQNRSPTSSEESAKKLHALQSQIDALNRAVRRYEKRAAAQTMQTESRLQELETQLKNALTLAAAAANYSQQPGAAAVAANWASAAVLLPLRAALAAVMYPVQAAGAFTTSVLLRLGIVQTGRREKQGGKQQAGLRAKPSRESLPARRAKKS